MSTFGIRNSIDDAMSRLGRSSEHPNEFSGGPKPSAFKAAILRAAHQLFDEPLVLEDRFACKILGAAREAAISDDPGRHRNALSQVLRATMAVRSRLAEDSWLDAQHHGVRQLVVLGAGLDTLAYRANPPAGATLFEVDLPSVQRWKKACLSNAGIGIPPFLRFVGIDFSEGALRQALADSGFDPALPAFFSWLGVSMYLSADDVSRTLSFVTACATGSSVVFDYLVKPELLTVTERAGLDWMAVRLAEQGEELKSTFDPVLMEEKLRGIGFNQVENLGPRQLEELYLSGREDGLRFSTAFRMIKAAV